MEGHEGHIMTDHAMSAGGLVNMTEQAPPASCSMNMLLNWQVKDVCIVFEFWHIHDALELVVSCLAVFLIAAGYEYLRAWSTLLTERWSQAEQKKVAGSLGGGNDEEDDQHGSFIKKDRVIVSYSFRKHALRSLLYAVLVAVSFWLMLVFMTYNGFLMTAVVLGAGFGHLVFGNGRSKATRDIQCH